MFNLSYIILDRDDLHSIDAFGDAILDDDVDGLDGADESDVDLQNYNVCSYRCGLSPAWSLTGF